MGKKTSRATHFIIIIIIAALSVTIAGKERSHRIIFSILLSFFFSSFFLCFKFFPVCQNKPRLHGNGGPV